MIYSNIQYNTIQYNEVQYNSTKYNTMIYSKIHNTIQYNEVQYNTTKYNTIQYNEVQYNTTKYNTIQQSTIQYKTQYSTVIHGTLTGLRIQDPRSGLYSLDLKSAHNKFYFISRWNSRICVPGSACDLPYNIFSLKYSGKLSILPHTP